MIEPLSPEEAIEASKPNYVEMDSMVAFINNLLRRSSVPGKCNISWRDISANAVWAAMAVAKFRNKGWTVDYVADQRDGDYYAFSK
jgi:hypothetical protein